MSQGDRLRKIEVDGVELALVVGVARVLGVSPAGRRCTGTAVLHRLEGPQLDVMLADVSWGDHTRCIQGLPGSSSGWADHLTRLVIRPSPRHRSLVWTETRTALRFGDRVVTRRAQPMAVRELTGLRVPRWLASVPRVAFGTREELLGDLGRRRREPCAVFEPDYTAAPAVLWAAFRLLPASTDQAEAS